MTETATDGDAVDAANDVLLEAYPPADTEPEIFWGAQFDAGLAFVDFPVGHGGLGVSPRFREMIARRLAESGAPTWNRTANVLGIGMGAGVIASHGTEEQMARWLRPMFTMEEIWCQMFSEPGAGSDIAGLSTRAVKDGGEWVVNGQKVWTSRALHSDLMLLLARTTAKEECARPFDGISLFYTDLDRDYVDIRVIPKMGRKAVDSNELFFDGLKVPAEDLIGEEGKGFSYLLDGLNPERILVGVEAVGIGRAALARAADYARERVVFGRPIGQNQAIQHPLADSWAKLEAANLMAFKAATLYDSGAACGVEANAAKYLGAEAGFEACTRAVLTHGGMGYAREFHVERYMREILICRIAPVTPHLILSYLAERALGLPKSY